MSLYGYYCKGCDTPIVGDRAEGGEKCILIHVRHGTEIRRTSGKYAECEQVKGDDLFGSERLIYNPNSRDNILKYRDDDYGSCGRRIYNNKTVTFETLLELVELENYKRISLALDSKRTEEIKDLAYVDGIVELINQMSDSRYDETLALWNTLKKVENFKYSGLVAWHVKCYHDATEEKNDLTPSLTDPNQSWGVIRKKYK